MVADEAAHVVPFITVRIAKRRQPFNQAAGFVIAEMFFAAILKIGMNPVALVVIYEARTGAIRVRDVTQLGIAPVPGKDDVCAFGIGHAREAAAFVIVIGVGAAIRHNALRGLVLFVPLQSPVFARGVRVAQKQIFFVPAPGAGVPEAVGHRGFAAVRQEDIGGCPAHAVVGAMPMVGEGFLPTKFYAIISNC